MSDISLLEKYLYTRGLIEPASLAKLQIAGKDLIVGEDILKNDELLGQVAGAWEQFRPAIEAVLAARVMPMIVQLIMTAPPEETIVIRQSLVEVASLVDDFTKYHSEHIRRKEQKETPPSQPDA